MFVSAYEGNLPRLALHVDPVEFGFEELIFNDGTLSIAAAPRGWNGTANLSPSSRGGGRRSNSVDVAGMVGYVSALSESTEAPKPSDSSSGLGPSARLGALVVAGH